MAETLPHNRCSVRIVDDEKGPRRALEYVLRPHFHVAHGGQRRRSDRDPATRARRRKSSADSANLDLLRSTAVILVFVNHLLLFLGLTHEGEFLRPLGRWGVQLFFVHCSLVLMMSLERQNRLRYARPYSAFLIRRCFRILPLSVLFVAVVSLVSPAARASGVRRVSARTVRRNHDRFESSADPKCHRFRVGAGAALEPALRSTDLPGAAAALRGSARIEACHAPPSRLGRRLHCIPHARRAEPPERFSALQPMLLGRGRGLQARNQIARTLAGVGLARLPAGDHDRVPAASGRRGGLGVLLRQLVSPCLGFTS